jgi:CubicO group peptidase (beta-lactamase class C family)
MATVRPETVGMSSDRLRRVEEFLEQRYIGPGRLPCAAVLVSRSGKTVFNSILGLADVERSQRARENTIYRIYSMTKPLTSVMFMMLVEEGKVALDDPVHRMIPEWRDLGVFDGGFMESFRTKPAARPMQMVDLLRHTSGLTYGFQERTNVDAAYRKLGIGTFGVKPSSLQDTIGQLAQLPLEFSPGDRWNYSVSTDVLGYLIEKIEGKPFEIVLRERLIDPLGMVDTDFQVPENKAERLAACYQYTPGKSPVLQDDPSRSAYLRPPVFVSGGGGLVSTTSDYLRFCGMLLNGGELGGRRFLSPKTLALMTSNHLPGGKDLTEMSVSLFSESGNAGVGFGLGFAVVMDPAKALLPTTRGEYYWGGAASTAFWIDPAEELIVIFMTQLLPSAAYPIRRELRTLVYAAMTEIVVPPSTTMVWPVVHDPAREDR